MQYNSSPDGLIFAIPMALPRRLVQLISITKGSGRGAANFFVDSFRSLPRKRSDPSEANSMKDGFAERLPDE
jgi:hypothetical protein